MSSNNLDPKKTRVELYKFLDKLVGLHERTISTREDWCLLLEDLQDSIKVSRLEEVVKEYGKNELNDPAKENEKNALKDIYEYLCLLSKQTIISSDQVEDIYEDLKVTIETIIVYLPRTYFRVTKWDKIPFLSCLGFLVVFLAPQHSVVIAYIVAIIGLAVAYYCKLFEEKENSDKKKDEDKKHDEKRQTIKKKIEDLEKESEKESEKNERISGENGKTIKAKGVQFRIFAAVFGFIAAWAIVAPVEGIVKEVTGIEGLPKFLISEQVILISSFFAIGILFYHGGILVLSSELAPLIEEGNKMAAFVSSLIIFFEGIVLFMAAKSTHDIAQFSLWIFVLLAFDIIWLLINIYTRIDVTFQWLHLNTIMLLFLWFGLLSPYKQDSSIALAGIDFSYWALLIVFLLRSAIDYKIGWKYWTKIPLEG